ncbi:MAG: cation efflux system protein [Ignavibacteriaceae bacterium]|nr:MAG: cation transporter [Chlorobiota bacterium]GJQ31975.1 MAG: cation efflux system protein [Ignavibacteriaceae bacterium]
MKQRNLAHLKGLKTTIIGIVVSFFLVIIKGAAGIFGNSYALVADAIESLSDIFTSTIVLLGIKYASRPKDADHPYGHGKAEPLAGLFVALMLMVAAIVIIVQSLYEIITPHHAPAPFTLVVLVVVVVVKETLFRKIVVVGEGIDSIAVKNDAWHHRSDAITSAAAFIGISIALIGGPGYEEADDYAALFASFIIIYNAISLFMPALKEILDTAPPEEFKQKIKSCAREVEGVKDIEKCFVRKMGLEYYIDMHVIVNGNLSVFEGHLIAHLVKDKLIEAFPNVSDVLCHIEPWDPEAYKMKKEEGNLFL